MAVHINKHKKRLISAFIRNMVNLEIVIKQEAEGYYIGQSNCAEVIKQIINLGKERGVSESVLEDNIHRIGEITRQCTNPYQALSITKRAYQEAKTNAQAQGIIGCLHTMYLARTHEAKSVGAHQKFTPQEIAKYLKELSFTS